MFNGGLQARNQGQLGTCYSESTTRLILKLFKHPNIKLLGDIKDKISSKEFDELQDFENKIVKEIKNAPHKKEQKRQQIDFLKNFLGKHNNPQKDPDKKDPPEIPQYFTDDYKDAINKLYNSYINLQTASIKKTQLKAEMNEMLDQIQNNNVNNNAKVGEYNTKVKEYTNDIDEFKNSYSNLFTKSTDFVAKFNKDNTPEISKLLEDRKTFVENNTELKNIIDEQNNHFNKINNFIISKFDTEDGGGSPFDVMNWFVNYVNDDSNFISNDENNLNTSIISENNNQCKEWDQDINQLTTDCQIDYTFLYELFKKFNKKLNDQNLKLKFVEYDLSNNILNDKNIKTVITENRYLVANLEYSTNSIFATIFEDTYKLSELNTTTSDYNTYCNKDDTTTTTTGHVIVITGYDDDNFIIKNSWGYKWGDFGKLKINKNIFIKNLCIANIYTIDMVPIKKGGISTHKYQTKRNRRIKAVMNRKKITKKIHKRKKTRRNKNTV